MVFGSPRGSSGDQLIPVRSTIRRLGHLTTSAVYGLVAGAPDIPSVGFPSSSGG
jgi:hypothetical protein